LGEEPDVSSEMLEETIRLYIHIYFSLFKKGI
jgi:hypothetical protein